MKLILSLILLTTCINSFGQNKNKWFGLIEVGTNKVINKNELNFGLGVQYYLSNKKSISLKIKYFKTGVNFYKKGSSCGFASFFCSSTKILNYEGLVIKVPLNFNWEFNLINEKLKILMSGGIGIDFSVKDNFIELQNIIPDTNKINGNINFGFGLISKINNNLDFYAYADIYSGNAKSEEKIGLIFPSKIRTDDSSINFGLRYKL